MRTRGCENRVGGSGKPKTAKWCLLPPFCLVFCLSDKPKTDNSKCGERVVGAGCPMVCTVTVVQRLQLRSKNCGQDVRSERFRRRIEAPCLETGKHILLVENTVFFSCERFCRVLGLREAAVVGGSHHCALDPKLGNNNPKTSGAKNCAV